MTPNQSIYPQHFPQALVLERELISLQQKRKIFFSVILAHIMVLVVPFIIYYIKNLLPQKPRIIKVKLLRSLPQPPSLTQKKPDKIIAPPEAPKKTPEPPKKPDKPKKKPPEKPKKKAKIPPKNPDKPKKKPPEKPKKVSTKPKKVPTKPKKRKYLSADDIIKPTKVVTSNNDYRPEPVNTPTFSAKDFADKLKKIRVEATISPSSSGTPVSASNLRTYFDTVSAYVYQRWRQPGKSLLGNRKPTVVVSISVAANGRIVSARVSRASGISAMDRSVKNLLSSLSRLPRPPKGAMQFDITLEIVD